MINFTPIYGENNEQWKIHWIKIIKPNKNKFISPRAEKICFLFLVSRGLGFFGTGNFHTDYYYKVTYRYTFNTGILNVIYCF